MERKSGETGTVARGSSNLLMYVNWFVPPWPGMSRALALSAIAPTGSAEWKISNRDHAEVVESWSRGAGPCGYTTVDRVLVCWGLLGSCWERRLLSPLASPRPEPWWAACGDGNPARTSGVAVFPGSHTSNSRRWAWLGSTLKCSIPLPPKPLPGVATSILSPSEPSSAQTRWNRFCERPSPPALGVGKSSFRLCLGGDRQG